MDNSIFINNTATKNIVGSSNVIVEYNWWANTIENYNTDISKTESVTVKNWLFLKIDADAAITGDAILSLNNVYNCADGKISTYSEYALKPIPFDLGGLNSTSSVLTITLNDDGQSNYQFRMDRINTILTAGYGDVNTNKKLEYTISDDGSFRALNEIIFFSEEGAVIELTHDYVYSDIDNITDGIVIPRKITINGNGHTIDAKSKTRIFMIPEGVSHITINNISFINSKASYGSVIVISHYFDYANLSYCNFTNNVATDYGGVIDCVGDYCTIENCNFINNHAVSKSGVIRYYHDNQAYIKNSNFINNRVADGSSGGGVIYVDAGAVNIDKSAFINNVANDRPGSVLFTGKSAIINNSMFLNNTGLDIIHGDSKVELVNNWFGNNATNYETINGNISSIVVDNWLFLNATVNPNSIQVGNSSMIVFKLYSYNQTANKVKDYDNSKFNPIDLTIAPRKGGVDKETAHLEDQIKYTATNVGEGSVTASRGDVIYTIKLTNNPADTEITVNNPTITLNAKDTGNIIATLNPREAGRLSYTSNDTSVATVDNNGKITAHKKGYVKITISFAGNTNYNAAADKTVLVTVKLMPTSVSVNSNTLDLEIDDTLNLKVTANPTGLPVSFTSNDESIVTVTNTGIVKAIGEGTATITLKVGDNTIYAENSTTVTVKVSKISTTISIKNNKITLNANYDVDAGASLNPASAGTLTYTSNNVTVAKVVNDKIIGLSKGTATITISYKGNNKYTSAADKTIQVTVKQKEINTQITGLTIPTKLFEGKETTITGTLTANNTGFANQKITINITNTNGYKETYTGKTDSAGKFSIKINPKVNGPVTILTTYTGNSNYKSITISQTKQITVNKGTAKITITPNNNSIKAGEKVTFTVKLTDANTKTGLTDTITIKVNGKSINAKVKNGKATVTYTVPRGTDAQTIKATTTYSSKYHNKATATSKFKVTKTTPTIKKTKITYKNKKATIKATIKDATKKLLNKNVKVTVKVDGKTVLKNTVIKNGKISLSFKKALKKGNHKLLITSSATGAFNSAKLSVKFKV